MGTQDLKVKRIMGKTLIEIKNVNKRKISLAFESATSL